MNKKNTSLYLYILIVVFTLFVGGATYAFFAGNNNIDAKANLSAETGKTYTFTSTSATNFELNLTSADMQQSQSGNYVSSTVGTIDVSLTSPEGKNTVCTFDLLFTWTSTSKYTTPNVALPYTNGGTTYNYEFSTLVKDGEDIAFAERDLSKVNAGAGFGSGSSGTIAENLSVSATGGTTTKTYSIEARIYNLPVNQPNLIGKNMKASVKVDNLNCEYSDEEEEDIDVSTLNYLSTNYGKTIFNLVSNQGVDVANVDSIYFVNTGKTKPDRTSNVALFKGTDGNAIKAWTSGNNLYIGSKGTTYPGPSMDSAFYDMENLNVLDMNNVNTSKVTNMARMFSNTGYNSPNFTLNLGNQFNTSNVLNMEYMFSSTGYGNSDFVLNLGNQFNTINVINMTYMFSFLGENSETFTLDLGDLFNTSNVTNMMYMFGSVARESLSFSLNLGNNFNTSNVRDVSGMFFDTAIESAWTLDLRSFDFTNASIPRAFFSTYPRNKTLTVLCNPTNGDFINAMIRGSSGYNVICS